tara:strand:- start:5036 stop:5788 length:753 start_codon:yes stop_codon:yes gene_type:complete
MSIQKYLKDKLENKGQYTSLYHGVKLDVAEKIIDNDKMEARTTQRYWEDGKKRKDNDPDYETSKWMKGWSMTRSFDYAFLWSGLVLEFDKADLQKEFKIEPISWNYTIGRINPADIDHKKEREEFIVASRTGKNTKDYERIAEEIQESAYQEYEKTKDVDKLRELGELSFIDLLKKPEGKPLLNVNNKIKSIYISNALVEIYSLENEKIQKVLNHPKFKGILKEEEFQLKVEAERDVKRKLSYQRKLKNG